MSEHTTPANPKPPSVDRLSHFWRRITDHKIAQWSVAYVALAYGIQHGVELTSDAFEWSHAVVRVSMLLLVLGLPLVMTLAWYHGERASHRISGPELTIISLLLVGISLLFYVFARPSEEVAARPRPAVQQAGVATAPSASLNPGNAISIAVLPFLNLSRDPDQEFFSDGMTEEITSALAKVPNLRVVARTSAFQFKGENRDIQAIAQALHATHLIEGSVRRDGNQLRITAQLIKANDGTHLWTESYDRELKGVFAVQEEIAQAIAAALRVPLGLRQGEALVSNRTDDLASYQQYLHARALYRARAINEAIAVLEPAVARDPNYAPAWGLLAEAYILIPLYEVGVTGGAIEEARRVNQSSLGKAEKAAREAIRLDPRNAGGRAALAHVQASRGKWTDAADLFREALALDPNDADGLHIYSLALAGAGDLKLALSSRELLRTLEPFVPVYNIVTAEIMQFNGQSEATIPLLEATPTGGATSSYRNLILAQALAAVGRYGEAADTLLAIPSNQNLASRRSVEDAARLLRSAPAKVSMPETLPILEGNLNFVYAYVGAPSRALEAPERSLEIGSANSPVFRSIWHPLYAPLRKTERFKVLMRKAGLVDYWTARGWPDLCRPMGRDDFVCD